jgi:tetratricopeptide (TPR) repeat protein
MSVAELEKKFFELKGKLDVGVITEDEFKAQVGQLRFQDAQSRWWMIGAQSGKWYSFDGMRWIPGTPPSDEPAPSIEPPPPPPSPVTPPPPPLRTIPPPIAPPPSPEKKPPPQPEHIPLKRIERRRPHTPALKPITVPKLPPIAGPLLIAGAAMLALLGVIVMWFVLDNVLPNKPISQLLGNLTGAPSTPVASSTPGASASTPARDVTALIAEGDRLVLTSQIDAAITQYQSAAQLAPQNVAPVTRLARALAFKGQLQEAVNRAQVAVQRAPTDADAAAQFCRALTWNGQVSDALAACERAAQIDAKNANALAFLAEAYLVARRTADAAQRAQAAVQLAPQSAEAHRALAWVLTMQGNKDTALIEWKQTVALEPDFYFRHFEYGEVLRLYFNNPAEAATAHRKAVTLYGAYIPAINRLGMALVASNRSAEAIPQFQRALTLDPASAENYAYLGVAYGQTNRCNQAIPYFEQALRLDANNSLARQGMADCRANKAPVLPAIPAPTIPLPPPTLVPQK